MLQFLADPSIWASFLTLTVLEIILGVDNVIFLSVMTSRLPKHQRRRARLVGLSGALALRIALLFSIVWLARLTEPVLTIANFALSWRDVILGGGGLFLLYKATSEIFAEMEPGDASKARSGVGFVAVVVQIMVLDLVFSIDSVITAVGIGQHLSVMIAAITVAVGIMMIASEPIGTFVERHPSAKMLALAFLVMVGMTLLADGAHFHVDREFIYAAMLFSSAVEALNLLRNRRRKAKTDR